MTATVTYRWAYAAPDGTISTDAETLQKLSLLGLPPAGTEPALLCHLKDEAGEITEQSIAFVNERRLPTHFTLGEEVQGTIVPHRFHEELADFLAPAVEAQVTP